MIPVHIISGFLGVGKTTAIRAQLAARSSERVAVIVNDFGDAGFDELSIADGGSDAPFQITNIPGGCVCCTAPEGFVGALGAVLDGAPDRVLIEPTGLARPQDLVDTIRRGPQRDRVALGPVLVLVDPSRLGSESESEAAILREQAEIADVLVANRADLASDAEIARFRAFAEALWPSPLAVHETRHGEIPTKLFEWPDGEGPRPRGGHDAGHHHGPSTDGFRATSQRWGAAQTFDRARLDAALERARSGGCGAALARLKGVFRTQEGVIQLEIAGGERHERPSSYRRDSRVDAIFETAEDAPLAAIQQALGDALLSHEELRAQANRIEFVAPDGAIQIVERGRLAGLPDPVADVSVLFPKRKGEAARIGPLLDAVGAPGGGHAVICAADGFASEPVPLRALREGVLLHSIAGAPLGDDQGGPFRLLIPEGVEGAPSACANVKAVTRIVLRS